MATVQQVQQAPSPTPSLTPDAPVPPLRRARNGGNVLPLTGERQAAVNSARLNHPCTRGLEVV